jgi:hypothetical protein
METAHALTLETLKNFEERFMIVITHFPEKKEVTIERIKEMRRELLTRKDCETNPMVRLALDMLGRLVAY